MKSMSMSPTPIEFYEFYYYYLTMIGYLKSAANENFKLKKS
jgi:hypothetical protein